MSVSFPPNSLAPRKPVPPPPPGHLAPLKGVPGPDWLSLAFGGGGKWGKWGEVSHQPPLKVQSDTDIMLSSLMIDTADCGVFTYSLCPVGTTHH